MKIGKSLKYVWLTVAAISMILTACLWFGYEAENLRTVILVLNTLMFFLSLPCSLFVLPVYFVSNHYLDIQLNSTEGVYLTTVFLSVIGAMQWFWIARFWSSSEQRFQKLHLVEDNQ